ncbi:MAG: DUF3047 domain-containing protein, partial [Betaproteobacteria bacterium]
MAAIGVAADQRRDAVSAQRRRGACRTRALVRNGELRDGTPNPDRFRQRRRLGRRAAAVRAAAGRDAFAGSDDREHRLHQSLRLPATRARRRRERRVAPRGAGSSGSPVHDLHTARRQDALRAGGIAIKRFLGVLFCAAGPPEIPRFSTGKPGGPPPAEWKHLQLASFKNNTDYSLVAEDGAVVLRAVAHNSASFLAIPADFDPHDFPMLSWRWKVAQGIPAASTAEQSKEDAPVRVMVAFDGDMSKLPLKDRVASSAARSISGQALPYATLMYVWGGKVAVDSITPSSRSTRVRMLAVAADDQGIGRWHSYARNLVEDFKRAFGEE